MTGGARSQAKTERDFYLSILFLQWQRFYFKKGMKIIHTHNIGMRGDANDASRAREVWPWKDLIIAVVDARRWGLVN